MSREKRWLVILETGEHNTLGRHTDPSADEIKAVGDDLDRLGVAGWLVVSEGVYYSPDKITLLMVRPIATMSMAA